MALVSRGIAEEQVEEFSDSSYFRHAVQKAGSPGGVYALPAFALEDREAGRPSNLLLAAAAKLTHDVARKLHGDEDDFAVSRFGHLLQGLELPDLHRGGRCEDVCCLAHEPGRVDLGAGSDDLGLAYALLLRGGGEGGGDLGGEDDVFDEDALDGDAPLVGDVADDFGDLERDGLALGDDALHRPGADDVAEGCLGALDERLAEVGDAERRTVGVDDLEVDDGVNFNVDVVAGNDGLSPDGTYLDLDIDYA